jgi:hypothetical protein
MSKEITITLPAIDETIIANLDSLTTQASATEVEALKAIREKYAVLARQNGYVKIGYTWRGNQNWSEEQSYHYERNGKRVKALLAFDNFEQPKTSEFAGENTGDKLYLLETGEWLRVERTGEWSQYQGSPGWWACGEGILPDDWSMGERIDGSIRTLTDAEVEAEYPLDGIVDEIGKSLKKLSEKLPERMSRVKQRAELASQLLAALN